MQEKYWGMIVYLSVKANKSNLVKRFWIIEEFLTCTVLSVIMSPKLEEKVTVQQSVEGFRIDKIEISAIDFAFFCTSGSMLYNFVEYPLLSVQ